MKYVSRVQTHDGQVHVDVEAAIKHLDKMYADVFLPVCRKLATMDKYVTVTDYLDENLEVFRSLLKIKDDMKLELLEDDEDNDEGFEHL